MNEKVVDKKLVSGLSQRSIAYEMKMSLHRNGVSRKYMQNDGKQ